MAKGPKIVGVVSDEMLAKIAHILGELSAAAHAIADLKKRRASGEDVVCYRTRRGVLLVGPRITEKVD